MFQDFVIVLASSVISFFVGRFTNKSKINLEIYKSQIRFIYAPLSLFFRNNPNYSTDSCIALKDLLNHLINDRIELFPETLLKLSEKINADINQYFYDEIKKHTNVTFENLKANVGLPTSRFSSRWKIMSRSDKISWFMDFIFGPAVLICLSSIFIASILDIANNIMKYSYDLEIFDSYEMLTISSFVFGTGLYILIFKIKK